METNTEQGAQNLELSMALDIDPFEKLLEYMGDSNHSKSISLVNQYEISKEQFDAFNERLQAIIEKQIKK